MKLKNIIKFKFLSIIIAYKENFRKKEISNFINYMLGRFFDFYKER